MEFLSWHYSKGISYYFKSWKDTILFVNHFFSPGLLLITLFSPYKRLIVAENGPGFSLSNKFQAWTFNVVSRGVGAFVRLCLISTALVAILMSMVGGAAGLLFWLLIPFLSYSTFVKYHKRPEHVVEHLIEKLKTSHAHPVDVLFSSDPGTYVLKHTNLTKEDLIQHAKQVQMHFDALPVTTFAGLLSYYLDQKMWDYDFFFSKGIALDNLVALAKWWDHKTELETQLGDGVFARPGIALELTFGYTPTLNKYVVDLSAPQAFTHHLIGRGQVVERMERNFISGQSVFLTGDPGVGKRTTVLEFATKAAMGQLGPEMSFKRVLEFDYNTLLSGTRDLNQKKVELNQVLTEAAYAGNVILMVRDLHRLINPDVEGYDFTDILEPLLETRALQIIAVTSNLEYERFIVPNMRIRKFFERVEVVAPNKEEASQILLEAADKWERQTSITILYQSLKQMLDKSDEYVTDTPFPEKVLELLDAVITYVSRSKKAYVEVSDVNAVLAEKTGISFEALTDVDKNKLGRLEDLIHERLVNQESAVTLIAKTLRSKTVGVVKEKRPIGSFLFLGPTGVGKTETAKVLARVYFGNESEILRFDMFEYSGIEGMDRLIGSVMKNTPGALTTAIKNKPAALLLLDELEKASREISNLFLTLLDEGYITDAFGKQVNCKNVFVIGTSNAGSEYIRQLVATGASKDDMQRQVVNHVFEQGFFSPEFLNRFDGVVVYEPLSEANLYQVARHLLTELADNLENKNIHLTFDDSAGYKLAKDGYDPAFGARPMRRILNLEIGDMLGKAILTGQIKEGDHVELYAQGEFGWRKK